MPARRMILVSPLVAVLAMGFALALAQDRGPAGGATARQQPPAARKAVPEQNFPPEAMDELLAGWEGQSAKLQTLEVDLYRIDKNLAWEDEEHFAGHAAFKNPDLAYIDYRKVKLQVAPDPKVKGKRTFTPIIKKNQFDSTPFQTILCTGKEVWDYRWDVKQIVVWTLDRDARKRALDEGPLPFLFHMRSQDAKRRYMMSLRLQNEKRSLVEILPLLKDDKDVFSTAWVELDRVFLLPTRIILISPDKTKRQDFRLSKSTANKPVNEKFFIGVKPGGKEWKLDRNPIAKDETAVNPKRARRNGDPQAAQRPGPGNTIQR